MSNRRNNFLWRQYEIIIIINNVNPTFILCVGDWIKMINFSCIYIISSGAVINYKALLLIYTRIMITHGYTYYYFYYYSLLIINNNNLWHSVNKILINYYLKTISIFINVYKRKYCTCQSCVLTILQPPIYI